MTVEQYLKKNGPTLSSVLIKELSDDGLSQEAIRKRISRLKSPVNKIIGFFKDNQAFYFLDEQFQTQIYFENLRACLKTDAKKYFSVIRAIEYHYGYIKKDHLSSFTFSPTQNLTSHRNISDVITQLKSLEVIIDDGDYYMLNDLITSKKANFQLYKGVELAKETILSQFYNYSKSIGLVSYNSGKFHSEFAKFQFGFVAPSYVCGITSFSKNILHPAFVLTDVLIGNKVTIEDVNTYLAKIDVIKNTSKNNFLPYLILDNVNQDAFKLLKSNGIIVGFVNKLFGSEYEELLRSLINTVANAGAILKQNPQAYIDLIINLNKLVDGKTNNLKGDLFELAVGYYYSNISQNIDIGRKINYTGFQREIDVYASSQGSLTICECKAYKRSVDLDQTNKWLTQKVPVIYDWIRSFENDKDIIFEFWSTSGFTTEAQDLLQDRKEKSRKYKIDFLSENEIIARAQKSKAQKIVEIMREYFIKD
ncbi:hypothetical protein SAMN05421846_104110 [Chryseobacterium taeanense]|uniref:Restriction endonuclease n=1 Tax=Chryseobacterium taeanense TaxID=311334 RepID=A0A1G8HWV5_9FLAO|nr:hypothetical protein [Chryseobacterium taeanense]SDI11146.1 hypothetical protein SAMN05421846_104110 [Chryseobacterium taeanense]